MPLAVDSQGLLFTFHLPLHISLLTISLLDTMVPTNFSLPISPPLVPVLAKVHSSAPSMPVSNVLVYSQLSQSKVRTATNRKITQLHNPRHTVKTHNRRVPCLHTTDASVVFCKKYKVLMSYMLSKKKRLENVHSPYLPNCMASRHKINEISSENSAFNNKQLWRSKQFKAHGEYNTFARVVT